MCFTVEGPVKRRFNLGKRKLNFSLTGPSVVRHMSRLVHTEDRYHGYHGNGGI